MADRFALIIGSSEYQDPDLQKLIAPAQDAEALGRVLGDPDIGGFEVQTLLNEPSHVLRQAIESFFVDRRRDDLLLLYFSSHGLKDEYGRLYFATPETRRTRMRSTALSASYVNEVMRDSRSRRQVLLLDCCYSGAFAEGMAAKADEAVGTMDRFKGQGKVVLTASDALQYAFEGDAVKGEGVRSVFTRSLVTGLETGEADRDQDGRISLDELYDYAYDQVVEKTPQQKPEKWEFGVQGEIVIARNPNPKVKAVELPSELQESIVDPRTWVREGAVRELDRLLRGTHPGLAQAAHAALERLTEDDSRRVSAAARESLTAHAETQPAREEAEAEAERLAAEKAEAERTAAGKAEAERLTNEKAEAGVSADAKAAFLLPFVERLRRVPAWGWVLSGLVALIVTALFIVRGTQSLIATAEPSTDSPLPILLHVTFDNNPAVIQPLLGAGGTSTLLDSDFLSGQASNAAHFTEAHQVVTFPAATDGAQNIELDAGEVEFWYRPNYDAAADDVDHTMLVVGNVYNPPNLILSEGDRLSITLTEADLSAHTTQADYQAPLWSAGEWVHIRAVWDTSAADPLRLFIDGTRVDGGGSMNAWDLGTESEIGRIYIGAGNISGDFSADGMIDELIIRGSPGPVLAPPLNSSHNGKKATSFLRAPETPPQDYPPPTN